MENDNIHSDEICSLSFLETLEALNDNNTCVCQSSEIRNLEEHTWIAYKDATHILVGYCPTCGGGGNLMTARSEFQAYSFRRIYLNAGYKNVRVEKNDGNRQRFTKEMRALLVERLGKDE